MEARRHDLQHEKTFEFLGRHRQKRSKMAAQPAASSLSMRDLGSSSQIRPRPAQEGFEDNVKDLNTGYHHVVPGVTSEAREFAGVVVFSTCCFLLMSWFLWLVGSIWIDFKKARTNIDDLDWEFWDYVTYIFGYWLSMRGKSSNASLKVLVIVAAVVLLLGTFGYWHAVPNASIWHSAWMTYIWLLSPDGGIGERTLGGAFYGGTVSLCGVLVFALLLTLLNDLFNGYMDRLRDGNDRVMEIGHIVIIGLTSSKIHMLNELCAAHAVHGGISIVILLGGIPKAEMQGYIEENLVQLQGSKIIMRAGYPQYEADLDCVGANACRSVIIAADHRKDKEVRDAFVLQALLVLRSNGWPRNGHILLECSLLKNRQVLENIGGSHTDIVMTERWIARLFMQVSQQEGLGIIVAETFSFEGATLFIHPAPSHLVGKDFAELAWHYPKAIPVGIVDDIDKQSVLGTPRYQVIEEGQDIIFMAHTAADAAKAEKEPCSKQGVLQACSHAKPPPHRGHEPEIIIVVGWSAQIGAMLVQVDKEVQKGSRVICMSPLPLEDRQKIVERCERRWQHKLTNITLEHVHGMLGSPTVWDRMSVKLEEASRIFILSDMSAEDKRHADACTVAAVIQIRHLLSEKGIKSNIPIVPEIQDPRTERLCNICNISSYIDSSGMPVQVLAAVSVEPRLRKVLRDLVGDDGQHGISIRGVEDYLPTGTQLPASVSFMQIQGLVAQRGDVVIGWSWPGKKKPDHEFADSMTDYEGAANNLTWELNPESKTVERSWCIDDRICILGPHDYPWTPRERAAPVQRASVSLS